MGYQWSPADRAIGEHFLDIAREQIDKAVTGALDAAVSPARRIHEARRRCKRLRALFRLVRPDFSNYASANAAVRDAARSLAGARDSRVTRQTLADLLAHAQLPPADPAAGSEAGAGDETAALAAFSERMKALGEATHHWSVAGLTRRGLADGFARTYRDGRHELATALHSREAEHFHEWRKQAKYHWNQLKLLEPCAPDVIGPLGDLAGRLADQLGLHHDLDLLELAIKNRSLGIELVHEEAVRLALQTRKAGLELEIASLGRQLYAEKPESLRQRFLSYLSLAGEPA